MANGTNNNTNRLQIPVSRALADQVAQWAIAMEWSQGRMAAKLLKLSLEDCESLANWLAKRVIGKRRGNDKLGFLQQGGNSEVRLQIAVDGKTFGEVEAMALRLNHTPVRMAALLLDYAVDDNKRIYRFFGSWLGRKVCRLVGSPREPYKSAEVAMSDDEQVEAA